MGEAVWYYSNTYAHLTTDTIYMHIKVPSKRQRVSEELMLHATSGASG